MTLNKICINRKDNPMKYLMMIAAALVFSCP